MAQRTRLDIQQAGRSGHGATAIPGPATKIHGLTAYLRFTHPSPTLSGRATSCNGMWRLGSVMIRSIARLLGICEQRAVGSRLAMPHGNKAPLRAATFFYFEFWVHRRQFRAESMIMAVGNALAWMLFFFLCPKDWVRAEAKQARSLHATVRPATPPPSRPAVVAKP